jgi:hypothetical protein
MLLARHREAGRHIWRQAHVLTWHGDFHLLFGRFWIRQIDGAVVCLPWIVGTGQCDGLHCWISSASLNLRNVSVTYRLLLFTAIIADIFPEGNGRTLGLALYIAAWPTGVGLGTVCAGFIAYDNWRKYFYLHGGLCGAVVLMVLIILPDQHPDHIDFLGQIDWVGNVLVTAGVFLLLYVLSMAPGAKDGWGTPRKPVRDHVIRHSDDPTIL